MLDDGPLSHATIQRKRSQHRSEITSSIHADFSLVDKQQLVVHCDGKIMADTRLWQTPPTKKIHSLQLTGLLL